MYCKNQTIHCINHKDHKYEMNHCMIMAYAFKPSKEKRAKLQLKIYILHITLVDHNHIYMSSKLR